MAKNQKPDPMAEANLGIARAEIEKAHANTQDILSKIDERNKKIKSDKFVKVTTDTESIFGTGFEAEQDFSRYTIHNITGIVKVSSDEFLNKK